MPSHLSGTRDIPPPADLRKEVLAKRDGLSEKERRAKSEIICSRLLHLDTIRSCSSIMLYVNFRSEVHTTGLLAGLIELKKEVSVPKTYSKEHRLVPVSITDPEKHLAPGYCNILEPASDIITTNRVLANELDMVIVPGSVFDERGGRLGYGGGYYDRFLSTIPDVIRIGLAFDLQIVGKISLQPHDELLDMVITESRIIQTDRLFFSTASYHNLL